MSRSNQFVSSTNDGTSKSYDRPVRNNQQQQQQLQQQQSESNNNYVTLQEDSQHLHHPAKEDADVYIETSKKAFADILSETRRTWIIQACYIALAAILGALTRMILAQLFGEACANPGTIGWLSAGSPLCVTKDGTTTQKGGIIFADLPSNIIGSFLMGFFQDYKVLELAVPMAVAWLPPTSSFQRCTILHVAFKTGFCGSLTTFSSWNSEMIVIMYGTGSTQSTRVVKSILGYIVGMETALGSFACGCSLARRLHSTVNPTLAAEGDAMQQRKLEGMYINHSLPDFERRYLHQLDLGLMHTNDLYPVTTDNRISHLEKWRTSTEQVRRINHPLLPTLLEIENTLLVEESKAISGDVESIARHHQWDIDSLYEWVAAKSNDILSLPSVSSSVVSRTNNGGMSLLYPSFFVGSGSAGGRRTSEANQERSKFLKLPFATITVAIVITLLFIAVLTLREDNQITVTDRTMAYVMLVAPAGALFRWHLSKYNGGTVNIKYFGDTFNQWFPYGTFGANFIGSMISIITVAIEYRLEHSGYNTFAAVGTLRAIRIGFCGCLTTVSTFVAEVSGFMRSKTDHAYPYIFISLGTCATCGMILYGIIVYV